MAATDQPAPEMLKFAPFSSHVDVSFFQELANLKLNSWGLSLEPKEIKGSFQCARKIGDGPHFEVNRESLLHKDKQIAVGDCISPGLLQNVNTVEEFKNFNKVDLLQKNGQRIIDDIKNGNVLSNPQLLSRFSILSFADLKSHQFIYWFCFPALVLPSPAIVLKREPISGLFCGNSRRLIRNGINSLRLSYVTDGIVGCPQYFIIKPSSTNPLQVVPLSAWTDMTEDEKAQATFAFVDPSGLDEHPGWTLRNFLYLIRTAWGRTSAKVICYRSFFRAIDLQKNNNPEAGNTAEATTPLEKAPVTIEDDDASFILHLKLDGPAPAEGVAAVTTSSDLPQMVGWEANSRGNSGPKQMNLKALMDPMKLAESSADLNLSLMRWRAIPTLKTELLAQTRVLLLGAGTLGCSVARTLLGWGIRNITFVDNGNVSYSNPTRQSLFEFNDCANGGKPKAVAASDALKRIYPNVNSVGLQLTIPMPGHNIETELESAQAAVTKIEDLILNHDVIYLLTDTRESRWLPTMLCARHDKFMLDVALGMDSYLVMRHGAGPTAAATSSADSSLSSTSAPSQHRLGCYFCNDVVAPQNSTKDRTLDQQCTVTRPGLAPIASALAVELMVGVLHHPLKHHAPGDVDIPIMQSNVREVEKPLGCLPHQLRGFLSNFGMLHPLAHAFEYCTACNSKIVEGYTANGFEFVRNACNDASFLSKVSGLEEFQMNCESMVLDKDFDLEDEGDDF
jgi:ubiquitin-like modifier-activating enzyme ATG7